MSKRARHRRGAAASAAPRAEAVPEPPAPVAPASPTRRRAEAWIGLALFLAVCAIYWPVRDYGLVSFDDYSYVGHNGHVQEGLTFAGLRWAFTTTHGAAWIPLTWLSLMADAQLYGTNVGGFHITNVLLHAANAVLLFLFLGRATQSMWRSAVVACIFAVHPLRVESVAWVTERKDVLSGFLFLLTLAAYVRFTRGPSRWRYLATLGLFALGLMAKPMLITLPFVLLLLDVWPLGRTSFGLRAADARRPPPVTIGRLLAEKVPFLVVSAAGAAAQLIAAADRTALQTTLAVPLGMRAVNALESTGRYLVKAVWPHPLAPLYPMHPPWPLPAVLLLAVSLVGMSWLVVRALPRRPHLAVGWFWYLGTLVPVLGLVQIGPQAMADRFTYIPLIGVTMAATWEVAEVAARWSRGPVVLAGIALGVNTALVATTVTYLSTWRDPETLFQHAIRVTGRNPFAHYLLGLALAERGDIDRAAEEYRVALRRNPGLLPAHNNLGLLLADQGQTDEAAEHFAAAMARGPDAYAHNNLANLLLARGKTEEAEQHYLEALRIDPKSAEAHNNFGKMLAARGRIDEAVGHYERALLLKPNSAEAHNNLGNALAARGRTDDALQHYADALRLRPSYAEAHVNLALLLVDIGRGPEAVVHAREAVRLRPADASAHTSYGSVLARVGNAEAALAEFAEAVRLDPDDADAHNDWGNTLASLGRLDDAVDHFSAAARLAPNDPRVRNNLANVLAMTGRLAEAVTQYGEAIRVSPEYSEAHYNLGIALVRLQKAEVAIAHFEIALRARPDSVAPRTQLGLALLELGRVEEAITHLSESVRLDPGDEGARRGLARARRP